MTTTANIATAPGPFVMVKRLPYPYGGQAMLPIIKGAGYVVIKRKAKR